MDPIEHLTNLARRFGERLSLEDSLQLVVDSAAELTGAPRTSLRLLNPMRTKLVAACRAGEPLHRDPNVAFTVGEGLIGWVAQQHRSLRTGDADADPRFLARPDMKEKMGSFLGVPVLVASTCVGVLSAVHPKPNYFDSTHERMMLLLASIAGPHVDMARLSQVSPVDPITRAGGRLQLERFLADEGDVPAALALVDVDRFAMVNERFGPAVGDEVLRGVADRLRAALGSEDQLLRRSGEKFLVVLGGSDGDRPARILEQARAAIARAPVWPSPPAVTVTVSIGIAKRRDGDTRAELLRRTEIALAGAKEGSGNFVTSAS